MDIIKYLEKNIKKTQMMGKSFKKGAFLVKCAFYCTSFSPQILQ